MFGEINNPVTDNDGGRIKFTVLSDVVKTINLPYVNNDIIQAPNLMYNSNVPGTYIVKLSADGKK